MNDIPELRDESDGLSLHNCPYIRLVRTRALEEGVVLGDLSKVPHTQLRRTSALLRRISDELRYVLTKAQGGQSHVYSCKTLRGYPKVVRASERIRGLYINGHITLSGP